MTTTYHDAGVMTTCSWPGGCTTRTKDASGMCSRHRRFSANVWHDNGEAIQRNRRLATTIKMNQEEDAEFQQVAEVAQFAMEHRPTVHMHHMQDYGTYAYRMTNMVNNNSAYWNGTWQELPYNDERVQIAPDQKTTDHVLVVQNDPDDTAVAQELYQSATVNKMGFYAQRYNIFNGVGEEYDDAAEAIAQLDIGRRHSQIVTVMVDRSSGYDQEMFRLRDVDNGQEIMGVMSPSFAMEQDNEVVKKYEPQVPEEYSGSITQEQLDAMNELGTIRTTIEKYGVLNPSNKKLYLPIGWTEK